MIPEVAVQAAADAIEARMFGAIKLGELARAALEAAAPHLLAETVAEARSNNDHITEGRDGYSAGFHYALHCVSPDS